MDCRPADSSIHGTSQARILEWVAIPFSRGSSCIESMSRILDTGDQTHVSFIGRQILYHWATRDTPSVFVKYQIQNSTIKFPFLMTWDQ